MKSIFTFHGADHKCGTSMIAQCVSERLSERLPGIKLLLIHMENSYGLDYSPRAGESVERIRPYIPEKLIDIEDVLQKSWYKDSFHIIGGSGRPGSINDYTPAMSEYLLEKLSSVFELIICDSGCCMEYGLPLGALLSAGSLLLLCNQSENALRRFERRRSFFTKLELSFDRLIVNSHQRSFVNTPELIAKRLGFSQEQLLCVRRSSHGDEAEHDAASLLAFRERAFAKDIDSIADFIIQQRN